MVSLAAMLSACSGGGSGSIGGGSGGGGGSPTPTANGCSLTERQNWAFAQLNEWYLFPETLPASLNPAPYTSVEAYIDALTATARSQGRDRFFTYLTSIAEENAYYSSGSSAGFGIRLSYDTGARRVFVAEAFEGAPALAAGIDRGTEILAIGTNASNLQTVDALMTSGGAQAVSDALGPSTAGTTRVLRVTDAGGTRNLTVSKADYSLDPVSSRYGAKIITEGGHQYGYVNLRTFITPADPELRAAFLSFRNAGVTDIVIDLRYNGGGLVSISELIGDLLGRSRTTSQVLDFTTFRASKSAYNETRYFSPQAQSVAPTRIAFIGTGGTASASELTINAQIPYLHANAGLIGTNTYGKPVGQIAIDRAACDDRLRVIAFATENASHQGAYFNGLSGTVEASCRASDDLAHPMGDPLEASTRAALDFLAGRACTAISSGGGQGTLALREAAPLELLAPERPSTAQREVPGLF
ncbi:S41 family peptidase [Sphingomonas sp. LB-2]|uniref:S41 family peptidase n=1 Tax=Sphingomonas caeni TaxID=2984949 RepID=UPI002230A389|nr:S41 family peptidase [Sphingomonas caeni]MCW3846570.1 S41 family peptidase [Sphingomonas caeni]